MSTGIMIIGPSGSGKTTLGKIVAQKLGYLYFDVDDYIWKQNTDSPYTQMYTREEKISRLNTDIAPYEHFVMARGWRGRCNAAGPVLNQIFEYNEFIKEQ